MRPEKARAIALVLAAVLLAAGSLPSLAPAQIGPPAPGRADSTRAGSADSLSAGGAVPDSGATRGSAPDSLGPGGKGRPAGLLPFRLLKSSEARGAADSAAARPVTVEPILLPTSRVDLEDGRKRAEESFAGALSGWMPALLDPLPVFGEPFGSVRLPDGGADYRAADPWFAAEGATDRSLLRLGRFGGIAGLAATLEDPEGTGADVLDDASLSTPIEPGPIRGASDALAALSPRSEADPLIRPGVPIPRRFRTTLIYRKGDGDELVTGARIFSPTLGRGLMGSFSRHATGGLGSISESVTSRYRVTAGLPRWLDHTLSVEGVLLQRAIHMPLPGPEARAEMERASLAVRAASRTESRSDDVTLTLRQANRTDVPWTDAPRERWKVPEVSLRANAAWGDSIGGSVLAGIEAASARVSYRTGAVPDLRRRIESARLTLGARRPLGPGGVGADVAYDLMGRQRAEWDARASAWASARRAAARLDLESAAERPTWIDLWTPYRAYTIATDTSTIFYSRAGSPSLRARRQTGAAGFAALELTRGFRLSASGAAHHVTRDFGWTASAPAPLTLIDQASPRGDCWISFASLAATLSAGPVRGHALGWVRGGSEDHTPQAGSPPSRALEAEAEARRRFFGGDLLARLTVGAHVLGPRRGLVREPAQALWDAALNLDFGEAGVVLGYKNLFDRQVGSGVYDVETGRGEPLPGRTFHFGVVWNLLD